MKIKLILVAILCGFSQWSYSQTSQEISVDFQNDTFLKAILKIENITDYNFYFQENWFDESTLTKSYKSVTIKALLGELFRNTSINFLIIENKIILTNNSIIYRDLPNNYFKENIIESISNQENNSTVFYKEYSSNQINSSNNIITIGKQDLNSNADTFTISGTVKDFNLKKPVQGLVISITGKNINTTTNVNGYYSFEAPNGLNIIETKLLGFEDLLKNVIVYGNGTLNLELTESAELLDEVLIESQKDDNVKEAIVGVTKIETASIRNIPVVLGEKDILKVATTMPGIKTAGEGASGFNVRGGRVDQNLILLDNAVIYNPQHFLGFFSAINPFTSGSIDIYKASIPANFGGRLSSVFDIKTKTGDMEKISGEASIGPVTGNMSLEIPIVKNKASLITGVRATYSDWILNSLSEESLKNSEASFYDGIVKYNHKLNDKNSIQATAYYSKDKFSVTSDSLYSYNNQSISAKWNHSFNAKHKSELVLINSQYKYNIDYETNANNSFTFGYKNSETQFKLNMKYLHSKTHKLDYGFSSKLYNINPGTIKPIGNESIINEKSISKEKALESAIFLSDMFEINDKLLLNLGIRYSFYASLGASSQNIYQTGVPKSLATILNTEEYNNNEIIKTYGGPELRLSFRYFLSPNFSLKGSYNKTIQYIHLLSSNTTASPTDTWKLSDLNTKPQKADQFSLGLYKNLEDSGIEISLEGYYKKMSDILDYKVGAELLLNENIETQLLQGNGKAYGAELLIKKEKGNLNGWLGYSYSRSFVKLDSNIIQERVNNGDYFPANYDRPHDISLTANYKLTKRYSISTNFTYQTGRPITYPIGRFVFAGQEQVLYSDRNQFRIPDYYRLDLGLNIEGNHKIKKFAHSFWNISIYNVLGRNNPYSVFFVSEEGNIQAYKTSIFAIPVPTITYNFRF